MPYTACRSAGPPGGAGPGVRVRICAHRHARGRGRATVRHRAERVGESGRGEEEHVSQLLRSTKVRDLMEAWIEGRDRLQMMTSSISSVQMIRDALEVDRTLIEVARLLKYTLGFRPIAL